ncbi:MAG: SH3 domain-containing protein [Pseudonocardia sp.]|nr:SH3 domain-containing protein [Pseudonocardia sp.]MBO0877454.1 SH3 domain-containing protein [Pseudonocardia sp.]
MGKIDTKTLRKDKPKLWSWLVSLVIALVLGVAVLIDRGSLSSESGLSAPCRVEVTADGLTVHSSPDPTGSIVGTLHRGDLRGAQTTVRNGYRELADGNWALDQALRPLPGSRCS